MGFCMSKSAGIRVSKGAGNSNWKDYGARGGLEDGQETQREFATTNFLHE
jgi:hypothetical protein